MDNELYKQYLAACHAMQTGVATLMALDPAETSPKHLRVGVNCAMASVDALANLLIDAGLVTREEWAERLTAEINAKMESYREQIARRVPPGTKITLV